jgi:hypothetical protein
VLHQLHLFALKNLEIFLKISHSEIARLANEQRRKVSDHTGSGQNEAFTPDLPGQAPKGRKIDLRACRNPTGQ